MQIDFVAKILQCALSY